MFQLCYLNCINNEARENENKAKSENDKCSWDRHGCSMLDEMRERSKNMK